MDKTQKGMARKTLTFLNLNNAQKNKKETANKSQPLSG